MSFSASPVGGPPPRRPGAARAAHGYCFVVAVLVSGHVAFAVVWIALAEPYPEMDGPSAAYLVVIAIIVSLVLEAVVLWLVVVIAVCTYPRDIPAALVVVVLCGAALLHGWLALSLAGGTPVAYTVAHVAVVVLAIVTIRLLVAAHRTTPPETPSAERLIR